jgi:hypothetical protein
MEAANKLYRVIVYKDSKDGPIRFVSRTFTSRDYFSEHEAYVAAREYEDFVAATEDYSHIDFEAWDRLTNEWFVMS